MPRPRMMQRGLIQYIFANSRREQTRLLVLTLVSLPFYLVSLNLPKSIVNDALLGHAFDGGHERAPLLAMHLKLPDALGGAHLIDVAGWPLPRREYLFGLAAIFLVLVLVNLGFRYAIEMEKGTLGERLLRRLRFDLLSLYVAAAPDAARGHAGAEASQVVVDEVAALAPFVADFSPLGFLLRAGTALGFMMTQNVWLGVVALAIVCSQGLVVPWLRREQARLTWARGEVQRRLGAKLREAVDGIGTVRAHDVTRFERAHAGQLLYEIFSVRRLLFRRKFSMRFLNSVVTQSTPFLFYAIGGYLGLPVAFGEGTLDIGQLVAVLGAYHDLPGPVNDLVDWDQHRLEAQVRWDYIVRQVAGESVGGARREGGDTGSLAKGRLEVADLAVTDIGGSTLLEGVRVVAELPAHILLDGPPGGGRESFARVLGRQISPSAGLVSIAGHPLAEMPDTAFGARIAYAGPEPVLFAGTIRDNVAYGLKHRPWRIDAARSLLADERQRLEEAIWTGNPPDHVDDDWIDYAAAGVGGPDEFDRRVVDALRIVGMADLVFTLGLSSRIGARRSLVVEGRIVEARGAVRAALERADGGRLVASFDPARYNPHATLGENLLFGALARRGIEADVHAHLMRALADAGLTHRLADAGRTITRTMVDMFSGTGGRGHLFERYSFIAEGDLPRFAFLAQASPAALSADDRDTLAGLTLGYNEARHRLGLVDAELEAGIVAARARFGETLPADLEGSIEFYRPDRFCLAAPLRDNLLFGRISHGAARAEATVGAALREVLATMGLEDTVYALGLETPVGLEGHALMQVHRAGIDIARCLVKRPDVLILDDALNGFSHREGSAVLGRIVEAMRSGSLIATRLEGASTEGFDTILTFEGGRLVGRTALEPLASVAE